MLLGYSTDALGVLYGYSRALSVESHAILRALKRKPTGAQPFLGGVLLGDILGGCSEGTRRVLSLTQLVVGCALGYSRVYTRAREQFSALSK
jgi:hypothetical protein